MSKKFIFFSKAVLVLGIAIASCTAFADEGVVYFGESGPAHWSELDPSFQACSNGDTQSPVNFAREPRHRELSINYGSTTGEIFNVGHEVKIATEGDNVLTFGGVSYKLLQFHWHLPSEHRVNGRGYDMEMHFVHKSDDGKALVLGVFMKRGDSSGALAPFFANPPEEVGVRRELEESFDPADFLPGSSTSYQYAGSLTTPPCGEPLQWIVLAEPITISDEDLARYAELIPFSARPVQRTLK